MSMSRTFTALASTFLLACDSSSDPRTTLTLAMRLDGGSEGMVSMDPPGVDCHGPRCSMTFEPGTTVILTAEPGRGRFIRWGGRRTFR